MSAVTVSVAVSATVIDNTTAATAVEVSTVIVVVVGVGVGVVGRNECASPFVWQSVALVKGSFHSANQTPILEL